LKLKLLVFEVKGYFAHFRKVYSTTSSLSYAFPPRTTIIGLIAAIMGFERDSYYDDFSPDKCKIGLQIKVPIRRVVQTINYLNTDEVNVKKLRGIGNTIPVVSEFILAEGTKLSRLNYRIFLYHENERLMNDLGDRLLNTRYVYPPSLGGTNNLAELDILKFIEAEIFEPKEPVDILTVIPHPLILEIIPKENMRLYLEEVVPATFQANKPNGRILKEVKSYVYEGDGKAIKARVKEAFKCKLDYEEIVGVFM